MTKFLDGLKISNPLLSIVIIGVGQNFARLKLGQTFLGQISVMTSLPYDINSF